MYSAIDVDMTTVSYDEKCICCAELGGWANHTPAGHHEQGYLCDDCKVCPRCGAYTDSSMECEVCG